MLSYSHLLRLVVPLLLLGSLATVSHAQLNENCTVSILNRTAQVKPDGTWIAINVPANFGQVRARATCVENGVTRSGQSGLFTIPANGSITLSEIPLGAAEQIPASLTLAAPSTTLSTVGATTQLIVTAKYPDGSTKNVAASSTGTSYTNSNTRVATVSADGLVTAVSSGVVIISALHEGALGLIQLRVALSGGDTDNDGIPDDVETANGLNPNDPTDGFADADNDGLTNKRELVDLGTNPQAADTDGDTIADGEEIQAGADGFITNPLLRDTDGDGVNDNVEIASGSNPTDPNSRPGFTSLQVTPTNVVLTSNTVVGEASQQLTVTGRRADGSTVDVTTAAGTNYTSSDLTICNFGAERGRVFAGNPGSCTITVTNSGLTAQARVTVQTFAPTGLSFINLPGTTNNVDVSGDYAYVAAGAAGLHVVDVANPLAMTIAATRDTAGNANDVVVVGNTAYVADGSAGLQIFDVTDPRNPVPRGTLDTPGDAQDVVVRGARAYVADGTGGLRIIDVSAPSAPAPLGSIATTAAALGVDVTPDGSLAVVAEGTTGIQVIDLSTVANPTVLGSLAGGNVQDVVLSGNFVFLADLSRSFTSVDLSNPRSPVLRASTPSSTGGLLDDVAVAGRFAVGSDIFFVNDVPIIDVSTPATPQPRALLPFRSFGDDNGTGIAVDSAFVYLTTNRNRLFVGQYLQIEDSAGIAPTVRIVAPQAGTNAIEGGTLPVTVEASDDVAVDVVNLVVNGQVVATDTAPPYEFALPVPTGVTSLTFNAVAIDFGDNSAATDGVTVTVIPDPLTTATGRVVRQDGTPIAGVTVTCLERGAVTNGSGVFTVPSLPTIRGNIRCSASATVDGQPLNGFSNQLPPVLGGTVNIGDILLSPGIPDLWILGNDGNWSAATRWSEGVVPGVTHHAIIDAPGTYAVNLDVNPTLSSLTMGAAGGTLLAAGKTLSLNNNAHIDAGTVIWQNSTLTGPGTLTNNANLTAQGISAIQVPWEQRGQLLVQGANVGGHTTLTSANGFTNHGTMRLESIQQGFSSNVTVSSGVLSNANDGTIEVNLGSGGPRIITGNVDNAGTVRVNGILLNVKGPGQVLNQTGGSLTTTGGGVFHLDGGRFNFTGGEVNGTVYVANSDLFVAPTVTQPSTVMMGGSSRLLKNEAKDVVVWVRGSNLAGHTTVQVAEGALNAGTIRLESADQGFAANLQGLGAGFSNGPTGLIEVNLGSGGARTLSGASINQGKIKVAPNAVLVITGPYTAAGGTIEGPAYVLNAPVRVTGSPTIPATVVITGTTSTLGSDNLANNILWVQGSNAGGHTNVTSASGFTNHGTLRLESIQQGFASNVTMSNGALSNASDGVIEVNQGSGGVRVLTGSVNNAGTLQVGSATQLDIVGPGQLFNQTDGALTTTGTGVFRFDGGRFNFTGGEVNGTVYVANSDLFVAPTVTQPSTVMMGGNGRLLGNEAQNALVWVRGSNLVGHTTVQVAEGALNAGTIRLESAQQGFAANLQALGAGFSNGPTGLIEVNLGSGGERTISGAFSNQGKIKVAANAVLKMTGGEYTAAGGTIEGPAYVLNAPVRVTGSPATPATVVITGGSSSITSDNLANNILWVQGSNAGGHTNVTSASGFTNHGTLRLESIQQGFASNVTMSNGALSNASDGVIEVNQGSGGVRVLTGNVNNAGALRVGTGTQLDVVGPGQLFNQTGGTLTTVGTGVVRFDGGRFNFTGGEVNGTVYVANSDLFVAPTVTQPSTIMVGGNSRLLGNEAQNALVWVRGSNLVGHTVVQVAEGVVNAGTIRLESAQQGFAANLQGLGAGFSNGPTGVIEVNLGSGGTRIIDSPLTNQGRVTLNTPATIGRAGAEHVNSGEIQVVTGVSTLTGNFSQTAAGKLTVTVGGNTARRLNISGSATLDGTLTINLASGFTPVAGNSFQILGFASRTGQFATVNAPNLGAGLAMNVSYTATGVTVTFVNASAQLEARQSLGVATQRTAAAPVLMSTGLKNPEAFAVGDLNNDGKVDVAIADKANSAVAVQLNNGDGTFGSAGTFPAGDAPVAIAIADVNGDDSRDVITANLASHDVTILFGRGDGSLQPPVHFEVGKSPHAEAVGHVNHDGIPDIITANSDANSISVLIGNRGGSFQTALSFPVAEHPIAVATGDLNADGAIDVVTANEVTGDVSVLLGAGDGTFTRGAAVAVGAQPSAVTIADIDRDGRADLVVSDKASEEVAVLIGNGDGQFRAPQRYAVGKSPVAVVATDIDGDARVDVLVANQESDTVSVLVGTSDGTLTAQPAMATGQRPSALAVTDINGDTVADVLILNNGSGDVSVLVPR